MKDYIKSEIKTLTQNIQTIDEALKASFDSKTSLVLDLLQYAKEILVSEESDQQKDAIIEKLPSLYLHVRIK